MPLRFGPELAQSVRMGYGRPLNLLTALWPTGTEAGMWLDQSDASTAFQDSAGTTAGAIDSPVGKRVSKAGNLSEVLQATATARPVWKQASGIYSDLFDGTDDGYATATFAAGTLTANMDLFVSIKRATNTGLVLASDKPGGSSPNFFLGSINPSAGTSAFGIGASFTNWVNGSSVPDDRVQLNAAIPAGAWKVFEVHNANLAAAVAFGISLYGSSLFLNGDIGGLILCPAQSDANRAIVRRELGRKVGLSL